MPSKNIYVRNVDEKLFDEAAEILGERSLSEAIASVLKKAVEAKKAELEGMEEIEIEVGSGTGIAGDSPDVEKFRFYGKELAFYRKLQGNDTRGITYTLYLTRKGKYLLYVDDWSLWQGEVSTSEYYVYDSLEKAEKGFAPEALIADAKEALGKDSVKELDI